MRAALLSLLLFGCGASAEYHAEPKDPCIKKGPEVCIMEIGNLTCNKDGKDDSAL